MHNFSLTKAIQLFQKTAPDKSGVREGMDDYRTELTITSARKWLRFVLD
jgi:hypothetical protein